MTTIRQLLLLMGATLTGIVLAWIDTRPGWDDTGVTVGLVLIASFIWGAASRSHAWRIALAMGIWLPVANIWMTGHYESLVALAIAFIGAYAGSFARRGLFPGR